MDSETLGLTFDAQAGFYRGQPAIVLATERGLTQLGSARVKRQNLDNVAASYGLRYVDKYLPLSARSPELRVLVTDDSAYVEFGTRSLLTSTTTPAADWASAVKTSQTCNVLIVLGKPGPDLDQTLRAATGRRQCIGAAVDAIDASRNGTSSQYHVLTTATSTGLTSDITCTVLDSDVVLNLEKAAKGWMKPDSDEYRDLRSLMLALIHRDVRPGFGIAQLTWSPSSGVFDFDRRASLMATMDAWFDYGALGVVDASDLPARLAHHLRQPPPEPVLRDDPTFLLLPIYGAFLRLEQLWSEVDGFKAKQRVDLLRTYCDFVAHDLQCVSAHALQVAYDLLVGPQSKVDYVQKLLKPGKKGDRVDTLRGAAWDVLFMMLPEWAAGGDLDMPSGRTALVTADKALPMLRDRLSVSAITRLGPSKVGLVTLGRELDHRLEPHRSRIEKAVNDAFDAALSRTGIDPRTRTWDHVRTWIARLEAELRAEPRQS